MLTKEQIKEIEELTETTCLSGIIKSERGKSIYFSNDNNNFMIFKSDSQFVISNLHYLEVKWLKVLSEILGEHNA